MKLIYRFGVALCVATLPVSAIAQQATRAATAPVRQGSVETARKLVAIMQIDRTYDLMFESLIPVMADAMMGGIEHDAATAGLVTRMESSRTDGRERLKTIFAEEFRSALKKRYPELIEASAKEYAAAFTEPELQELLAFYSSGTGAKTLLALPQLQVRIGLAGQRIGGAAGQEAGRKGMERAIREMVPDAAPKS